MHQAYSRVAAGVQGMHKGSSSVKEAVLTRGKEGDWGKTMPFWCLSCGQGFVSVKRVLAHYAKAGHGNETVSVGSRGLTKEQHLQAFRLRNR
jgi:hypothetical protein